MEHRTAEGKARAGMSRSTKVELVSALAGALAALLGLVGVSPWTMAALAAIGVGIALLFEGTRIAALLQASQTSDDAEDDEQPRPATGMEVIGGLGAIALGVLGLTGLAPARSLPFAALVVGSALVLGSVGGERTAPTAAIPRVELACGIAAVALGVAALLGLFPPRLVLLALMIVSASLLVVVFTNALSAKSAVANRA